MKKALATLAAALIAAPALADHNQIEMRDNTFIPSARIGIDIWPRGEQPSVPHSGHGIEIGFTGASGEDSQTRTLGAPPLTFGGRAFFAPTTLNYDFDFRFVEIAYRFRHFFGASRAFGIEAIGGLGWAELDVSVSSATGAASEKLQSGGLVGGFGIVWKFLPQTSLQSRMTIFGSGDREGVTAAARFDVFVAQALGRHAAVRAGLTSWGLVSQRDEDDDFGSFNSHLRAGFGGLALGLELAF
ncbi:MAG TPA: hypothetical protein VEX61_10805 [Burkholderiales bacterium]|nr:hypothetical protein [Burkholderiales bacterium]